MKHVAKIILVDSDQRYLMLYRSNHPLYGNDADLPGGEIEPTESALEGAVRELFEETGMTLNNSVPVLLHETTKRSFHGVTWSLFQAHIASNPSIRLSWEHASYVWLSKEQFIRNAGAANDVWMHMVHDILINKK